MKVPGERRIVGAVRGVLVLVAAMAVVGCSAYRGGHRTAPRLRPRVGPRGPRSAWDRRIPINHHHLPVHRVAAFFTASGFLHDALFDPKVGLVRIQTAGQQATGLQPRGRGPTRQHHVSRGHLWWKRRGDADDPSGRRVLGRRRRARVAIQPCGEGRVSDVRLQQRLAPQDHCQQQTHSRAPSPPTSRGWWCVQLVREPSAMGSTPLARAEQRWGGRSRERARARSPVCSPNVNGEILGQAGSPGGLQPAPGVGGFGAFPRAVEVWL